VPLAERREVDSRTCCNGVPEDTEKNISEKIWKDREEWRLRIRKI
jgi:hypothetical protein